MSEAEIMKKCCGKWILDTIKTNEIYNYFLQFLGINIIDERKKYLVIDYNQVYERFEILSFLPIVPHLMHFTYNQPFSGSTSTGLSYRSMFVNGYSMSLQLIELKIGSMFKWVHVFWHCIDDSASDPKLKLIIDFNHQRVSHSLVLLFDRVYEESEENTFQEKYTPNNY